MVAIAQLVEHLIVVQKVARSSRVSHPGRDLGRNSEVFCYPDGLNTANSRSQVISIGQNKERIMLSFENDYSCTATPEIIERISEIAQNQYPGYGNDSICESAKAKIREACACPDAQIFFLVGGTQTNQTIIDSITPQYAGVIAASTAM